MIRRPAIVAALLVACSVTASGSSAAVGLPTTETCINLPVSSKATGLLCVLPHANARAAAKVFANYLCRTELESTSDFAVTHGGQTFAEHYASKVGGSKVGGSKGGANAFASCVLRKRTTATGLLTAMGAAMSASCFGSRPARATTFRARYETFAIYVVRGRC